MNDVTQISDNILGHTILCLEMTIHNAICVMEPIIQSFNTQYASTLYWHKTKAHMQV
jgi:hypothetical protein